MSVAERWRLRVVFAGLGAVPMFLAGWLAWVQVAQAGELQRGQRSPLRLLPSTADAQGQKHEVLPAPRGTIFDRLGRPLALDCETYEVRAGFGLPRAAQQDGAAMRTWLAGLADRLAVALVADSELANRADSARQHRERLLQAFGRAFALDKLPAEGPPAKNHPMSGDVLVAGGVDSLEVIEALHRLVEETRYRHVRLDFLRSFRRHYPDRSYTYGLVGHTRSQWLDRDGGGKELVVEGACGLETFRVLTPDRAASRGYLRDGRGRNYFLAPADDVPQPSALHTTLDVELQRIAADELAAHANKAVANGKSTTPKWGAMVLVEIESGDVLAAASWHEQGVNPAAASFAPYQNVFEPGSIVKPLVLAYAHEAGVLDWNAEFDCAPGCSEYRERIAGLGRRKPVRDDHDCARLSPHGIITNSSNIGAAYCGLLLAREQWADYMDCYGFRQSLGLRLPGEGRSNTNARSFATDVPLRSFRANSAISFSFGYEMNTTVMHVARAYLRLFRGAKAELRLCRGVEVEGRWAANEPPAGLGPSFRDEVVAAVQAAMIDVVSDDPKATGTHVHRQMLKELGIDLHGLVGGKTGTAVSTVGLGGGRVQEVRNASFVGFLPAERPRWLAVCVMQKDGRETFYGGSYAAPPVVRLLLQCQQLEQRRRWQQVVGSGGDGQVDAGR